MAAERKTFKRCQYEFNGREMEHFRTVDEYCNYLSLLKTALAIPIFLMVASEEYKKKNANKITNEVYICAIIFTVYCQIVSAFFMTFIWRSVSRYGGVNHKKVCVVSIVTIEMLSIVCLCVAVYQYFTLPSEKYFKMNSAFFYCIAYEVLAIIGTVIYLKCLINYCKELLNYCEQVDAVMWSSDI